MDVQFYDPVAITPMQGGALFLRFDTTGSGAAHKRVIMGISPGASAPAPTFQGVIGPITLHGDPVNAMLVAPDTIEITFPRSDINGATTYGWAVSTALANNDPTTGNKPARSRIGRQRDSGCR